MKLDLACGRNCVPGYEGVDIAPLPGVKHVVNLLQFPWPFDDGSVDEVFCSHYIEHIPMLFWNPDGNLSPIQTSARSVELLLKFFDEVYRILKPGGKATFFSPQAQNVRAYQDPSHRRFIVGETYLYLDKSWRNAQGLEHAAYDIACDFRMADTMIEFTFSPEQIQKGRLMHQDAIQAEVKSYWNAAQDLKVTLTKPVAVSNEALTEEPAAVHA